jgi:hypothetical protein
MDIQHDDKEDLLKQYLNRNLAEKAPEGFTDNVMNRMRFEPVPGELVKTKKAKSYVPLISVLITIVLIGAAYLQPATQSDFSGLPWLKFLKNISLPAFKINFDALSGLKLPDYLPYLFICILLLTFFDRSLNGLFHRQK